MTRTKHNNKKRAKENTPATNKKQRATNTSMKNPAADPPAQQLALQRQKTRITLDQEMDQEMDHALQDLLAMKSDPLARRRDPPAKRVKTEPKPPPDTKPPAIPVDLSVLDTVDQRPILHELDEPPTTDEIKQAMKQMAMFKKHEDGEHHTHHHHRPQA